ncbi:MAG: hypothetical protein JRJ20_02850 [Deltaproteobacteria bacterium]|nr:hypothetical protein [Deltaproteobacteria bacterium]
MISLDFHPDIFQEVREAYLWYEFKSEGLGDDFIRELEYAFFSIKELLSAAEKMAALLTEEYINKRSKMASLQKFQAVLKKVPDVPPENHDKL